ncbi:unnamed protein product [Arabidopsis arenosa]|uniref:Uncharacterized protein n=1 Tax=Arabidopsis arenosa TaxID=38785 RepID=A0A8S2AH51_ARAAE|nr:unnamed protein product [Arabidopsis arenosa]
MTASLHLYGVKAPGLALSSKRLEFGSKGSSFSVTLPSSSAVFRAVEHSCRNIALRVSCEDVRVDLLERKEPETCNSSANGKELTCVMKFGGSSAERMKEVANLILSFPDERPVIVLSAMGKTTNKLLKAVTCGVTNVESIEELSFIKELHLRAAHELGVETTVIENEEEEEEFRVLHKAIRDGGALSVNFRNGEGSRELSFLLQNRRLSSWRSMLASPHQAKYKPYASPFEYDFYEDLFEELNKYGEIESLNVCNNLSDHMVGNVYVQFREEEQAGNALRHLQGRFYAGRPIVVDFSPVTDFREATCRQYEEETCKRGGYCNFMHLKSISSGLRRQLYGRYKNRHSHSRSRSPYRHRSHEDRSHERHSRSRRYDDDDGESRSRSRRYRSNSPRHRRGRRSRSRSISPGGRRQRSPVRDGSEERRGKIEQWNREKEELRANDKCSDGYIKKDNYHQERSFQQEGC